MRKYTNKIEINGQVFTHTVEAGSYLPKTQTTNAMNARQAYEQNEVLTNELFAAAKKQAQSFGYSVETAIDKRVAVLVKYATSATEACAWELRGEAAKQLISQ